MASVGRLSPSPCWKSRSVWKKFLAMELAVSTGLGSGIGSPMASGDLGRDEERLAELARRERDCWRGPVLTERSDEVDDFLNRVGVADRDSLPLEGLRGENLEFVAGPGDAREADLKGVLRDDLGVAPGEVASERF